MAKAKMTKSEKINMGISLSALLISIASPFITYYWLDPQLQSFRNRGRLEVTPIIRPLETDDSGRMSKASILGWLAEGYNFEIINVGNLPVKDVNIAIEYSDPVSEQNKVEVSPPLLMDSSSSGNKQFITLKQAIAPKDKLSVDLYKIPRSVWVSNEFGERSVLTGPAIPFILTSKDGKLALGGGSESEPAIWYLWNTTTNQWERLPAPVDKTSNANK